MRVSYKVHKDSTTVTCMISCLMDSAVGSTRVKLIMEKRTILLGRGGREGKEVGVRGVGWGWRGVFTFKVLAACCTLTVPVTTHYDQLASVCAARVSLSSSVHPRHFAVDVYIIVRLVSESTISLYARIS